MTCCSLKCVIWPDNEIFVLFFKLLNIKVRPAWVEYWSPYFGDNVLRGDGSKWRRCFLGVGINPPRWKKNHGWYMGVKRCVDSGDLIGFDVDELNKSTSVSYCTRDTEGPVGVDEVDLHVD